MRTPVSRPLHPLRYVVIELKVDKFQPAYLGQLQFYVSVVDDLLRDPEKHAPTVGILLCVGSSERVVRYSLGASRMPMAVSEYTYDTLPADEKRSLPGPDEVTETFELVAYLEQLRDDLD